MSRLVLILPLGILVGVVVMLYIVTNPTDTSSTGHRSPPDNSSVQCSELAPASVQGYEPLPLDQHGPDDHHGPQELPRYQAHMQEGSPRYYINRSIEGWNFSATTKSTDAELLAQAIEHEYEKLKKRLKGTSWTLPPTIKVTFGQPDIAHAGERHATGFYIAEKHLVKDVLTKAQLSCATVEGRAYVLSGTVKVEGLEDVIETD